MKKSLLVFSLLIMICLLSACGKVETPQNLYNPTDIVPVETDVEVDVEKLEDKFNVINMATSEEDIVNALSQYRDYSEGYGTGDARVATESAAVNTVAMKDGAAKTSDFSNAPTAPSFSEPDYSKTNTQVSGVDEADIVKTDGHYIYILRDNHLYITDVNNVDTKVLSSVEIGYYKSDADETFSKSRYNNSSESKHPLEMYILNDVLSIIMDNSSYSSWKEDGEYHWESKNYVSIDFYDVSDRSNPQLIKSLGQDGYYMSSRLYNDKVYLVTNYYANSDSDVGIMLPKVYTNGVSDSIRVTDVCIAPVVESENYVNIGSYVIEDKNNIDREDILSILGGGSEIYMSLNNLYVVKSFYYDNESNERTESVYKVVDHRHELVTNIFRISIDDDLSVDATGKVNGRIDNQYSLDEYDDMLRIATTYDYYEYTTYTDEAMGFENYKYPEESYSKSTNNLYVLGLDLNEISSLEGLAEDESIYSIRFDGTVVYFCTFKEIDPLFTVDLSNPENPTILTELKITGFSEYLHPWKDGMLFGAGYEVSEEDGWREGMKLVMFDTSDKNNVVVANTTVIDSWGSEALYNPKAFLLDSNKNLIGFPSGQNYLLYSYDNEKGFVSLVKVEFDEWTYQSRSLYVDDVIYIVGDSDIHVIDMNSLMNRATIPFAPKG